MTTWERAVNQTLIVLGGEMRRTSLRLLGVALALVLFSALVAGQELATLRVTVQDQTGAVMPGATVSVKNTQTGVLRSDITESHGLSVIPGLAPGSYQLTAEIKGFTPRKMPVTLSVGQTASLTVTLGITVKQEVEVQDTAQGID